MLSAVSRDADPGATESTSPRFRVAIGLAGLAFGGAQINAIDLGRTLRARGHVVSVFAVRDDEVPITILPYAKTSGFDIDLLDPHPRMISLARAITRHADDHSSDVVHVFAPWLNRPTAIASVGWRRRAYIETNWNMVNQFWGSPRAPLIVGTGDMLDEARPRRRASVHLMEPPVDLSRDRPDLVAARSFRTALGVRDTETLLVIVSRIDKAMKSESILYVMSALTRLADPGLRLAVVGDGDAFGEVCTAASAANRVLGREAVTMTGSLVDPRPAYAAADIVIGMGGSAIRAMAHGKALIVVGERGFAEIYKPATVPYFRSAGFYGLGTDDDPVEHVARLIRDLQDQPAWRLALGTFGLAEAEERFGLEAAAAALEVIYAQALASVPRRQVRSLEAATLLAKSALERGRARLRDRRA